MAVGGFNHSLFVSHVPPVPGFSRKGDTATLDMMVELGSCPLGS